MNHDCVGNFRPLGTWLLCTPMKTRKTIGILENPIDIDNKTVSEGVAEVVRVGQGFRISDDEGGGFAPLGVEVGDKVIYRGFVRFGHPIGKLFGKEDRDYFLIKTEDILATVVGDGGTIGYYDEFVF